MLDCVKTRTPSNSQVKRINLYTWLAAIVWTALIAGSLAWDYRGYEEEILAISRTKAITAFEWGRLYRVWVSRQGGIYVPVTPKTPANPLLAHVPERDVTTPSGKTLTLMNSAHMAHQVFDSVENPETVGQGHITSLNPLNPANRPDPWEEKALRAFEKGVREVSEVQVVNGRSYLRLIRASITERPCLQCHGHQGYKVGDIRGGIGVTVPISDIIAASRPQWTNNALAHGLIWIIGLAMMAAGACKLSGSVCALQESEERYRAVVENQTEVICRLQADGTIFFVNEVFCRFFGRTSRELLGNTWHPQAFPDDISMITERLGELSPANPVVIIENRVCSGSGQLYWMQFVNRGLFDDQGRLMEIQAVGRDITDLKQAQLALQESEKRFRLQLRELTNIYTHTPAGLFVVDRDMRFLRINERMAEINGRQIEEHLGRTIDEVLPADLAANLKEIWRPVLERGESALNMELQGTVWWSPDVARHWLCSYHPLLSDEGEVMGLMGSVQDITDRKLAEQSARRSERFLRATLDALSANICVLDEQGTILSVNKGWCDFASSNPPMIENFGIGLNYLAICDAARGADREEAHRFADGIRSVLGCETGLYTQEYPCHSDEEQRWFQGSVTRFVDGSTVRVVITHENITERKRAGHALQQSEERYRAVVEDQTEVITRFLPDGTYTFVNDVYCRLFGTTRDELIGRSWQPAALADDIPLVEAELATMSPAHPVVIIENRVYNASGEVRWMQFVNRGFYDDQGRLVETQAVGRDITARKAAEQELRESNRRFSTVFHASPVAIAISHMESGEFIDVNDSFLTMCGYERSEVIGRTSADLELWQKGEDRDKVMHDLHEHGRVQQFETTFRYKSGHIGHLLLSGELIELDGQQYMVGMLSDITTRKNAEMILAGVNEELELQVAERTASLSLTNEQLTREIDERRRIEQAILDHQSKLQAMAFELSMAEERERDRIAGELHDHVGQRLILAKMKLDSLTSRLTSEHLEGDADEVTRLISQTIQDIRSLTFQIRPPLLASAGLEATVQWLGEELKEDYGLRMELIDDNRPKPLKYEIRSTVFQAVRELLLNVAKHAGTGFVQVRMERAEEFLAISIRDNGVGFDSLDTSERPSKAGGFGLFNVQQKIEYLGGCIAIDSTPGKGTMATIKVPLERSYDE